MCAFRFLPNLLYLLPALPLACPRPPLPPPPANSPGSLFNPRIGTTLTTGCWWNSPLLFISCALLLLILTPSFTWRTKQDWKVPTTFMENSTFSPPCATRQCFHNALSFFYLHHISMILSFLVKYDFKDSHKSDPKYASAPPISLF